MKHPRPIWALAAKGCKWPVASDAAGQHLFCNETRAEASPYCPAHHAIAYIKEETPQSMLPLSRCAAMGEGARRAGEGSLPQQSILVEISAHCTKEPSSGLSATFSHCCATGEGEMAEKRQ